MSVISFVMSLIKRRDHGSLSSDDMDDNWQSIEDGYNAIKDILNGGGALFVPTLNETGQLVLTRGDSEVFGPFTIPTDVSPQIIWAPGVSLKVGNTVRYDGDDAPKGSYKVIVDHVSADFATDLAAAKFVVLSLDGVAGGGEAGVLFELSYGGPVNTTPMAVAAYKLATDTTLGDEIEFTAMSVAGDDVHLELTVIPADDPGSPEHLGPVAFDVGDVSSDTETVSAGGSYPAGTRLLLTVWTSSGDAIISGLIAAVKST